jgi:ribosome-associated translation inhibitor RaiA
VHPGLRMEFVGMAREDALVADIVHQAARLESRHPAVTTVVVTVEARAPRKYERKQFNVRLGLRAGPREVVINREHDRDPNAALRDAFDAAARQLVPPG